MKQKIRDLSDLDLAMMLEDHFGSDNLLKGPSGVWLFEGLVWRRLQDDEIKAIAVSLLAEQVDKVMRPRVSSMVDIFRTHNWMSDLYFELGDPNLVVMADGYRAYENGRWVKVPTDKDLHRRITFPGKYTNARPDRFDRFLNEILCDVDGNPLPDHDQLRDLIWEMLGYCLVTHTRYEQCFIFEGPGSNGKSKIGTLAKDMVGRGNTASVQPAQMGNVFQRSHLECKLLNLVTELNQNAELEDGMFKAIVSGEMMSVEHKFQDPREIEPFAKHIILTNHMPRIRDYSDGLFRRVSIIKLLRKFDGNARDPNLSEKLKSEIDATTSRALDALGRLIDNGGQFTKPQSSEAAKAIWRADNNHVEQFLAECVYENADDRIAMQTLYDKYAGWFPSTGLRGQLGRSQFGKRIEAAGVPKRRMSEGYCFIGISLR